MSTTVSEAKSRPSRGAMAAVVIGMSVAVWWPAFTLGAWGTLFFDQLLTVWVASTAAFFVVLLHPRGMRHRIPQALALLVPSLWLALSFAGDDASNLWIDLTNVLGAIVALLGIPFTIWVLVRIMWPDVVDGMTWRRRLFALLIVVAIGIGSFVLGLNESRFMTCGDFTISGNSEPPGCTPGPPS